MKNAIEMIPTRTTALSGLINSKGNQLLYLQNLQRVLQGSVASQVNGGVLEVCTSFVSTNIQPQEVEQLMATILEFIKVCKKALLIYYKLIGVEDKDFHKELVKCFQSLTTELDDFISAIISELRS